MTEETKTPPVRVAIYVRSATEHFNPGYLERQERRCRKAVAEQFPGYEVAEVFRDSGISGRTGTRSGLEALLKKAADNPRPFDVVVVESTDRIARSFAVAFQILNLLHCRGVDVHFVDAPADFSYEGLRNCVKAVFYCAACHARSPVSI